jgi:acetylornithine deacetylase/succinyl-diaminopimelate desuccinylase-like protein
MTVDVVKLLCDLVAIPSVNPMGRAVQGDEFYESRMTDYLQDFFEQLGLPWQRQTIGPKQDNIVARLDGDRGAGGGVLMFEAHQDTVPVDGMIIPPWTPAIREGRVYGRGACDIKGGMACMLAVLARLARQRPTDRPTLVMACSVNEEYGFSGAKQIPRLWQSGDSPVFPQPPDAAIVTEPTLLDVVVAHKGTVRWYCHTHGRAAHSSQPERGDNAVYRMARVLSRLEHYATEILPTVGEHPLVGRPTLSVGLISGGISVNTVPDRCTIEIDRRLLPGEDAQEAWQAVRAFLQTQLGADFPITHDPPYHASGGLNDADNGRLATALCDAAIACGHSAHRLGVPYGTDAPAFAGAGVPTVVFGPGSLAQAHTIDEWIAIDQLQAAVEILDRFACHRRPE